MKKEMLQQVMTAPKKIEFRSVPVPEIGEDQVLVKIMKIGICGSDIHVYHGTHPFTSYPVTQGHELSAKVVKAGKNVTEFTEGQKVTIEPQVYCGTCYPCRHGKYNLCEKLKVMGFHPLQGSAHAVVVLVDRVAAQHAEYGDGDLSLAGLCGHVGVDPAGIISLVPVAAPQRVTVGTYLVFAVARSDDAVFVVHVPERIGVDEP